MKRFSSALALLALACTGADAQTYNFFPPPGYNCSAGPPAQIPFASTANKLLCSSLLSWNTSSDILQIGATLTPGTFAVGPYSAMTVSGVALSVPTFSANSNIQGNVELHSATATAAAGANAYGVRARGTVASPSAVQNGDNLLTLAGAGFDGTTYDWGAHIHFLADGIPSAGVLPGALDFQTTPSGSNTPVSVLKLDHAGSFWVNGAQGNAGNVLLSGGTGPTAFGALDLSSANAVTNTLPVTHGGTNVATLTAHGVLLGEGTASVSAVAALAADTLLQGQGVTADPGPLSLPNCATALTYSTSTHTLGCSGGGSGSVTSVGLALPGVFAVTGSPVTTSGTLTGAFASGQVPYSVLATPASGTGALALTAHIISPDTPQNVPSSFGADDEFNENALDTGGTRFSGATAWAWVNQGGGTAGVTTGTLTLTSPAAAGDNWRLIVQTPPTAPWEIRAKCTGVLQANFNNGGLVLYNSGNSHLITYGPTWNNGAARGINRLSNLTTFTSSIYGPTNDSPTFGLPAAYTYYDISFDGTTFSFSQSNTGASGTFVVIATETLANFLTALTGVGLGVNSSDASHPGITICDWFRRIS